MQKFEQMPSPANSPLDSKAAEIFKKESAREEALAKERADLQRTRAVARMENLKAKAREEGELDIAGAIEEAGTNAQIEEAVEGLFKEDGDKEKAA